MTCKDVKGIIEEYGTVADLVKEICTDRVCTLDDIQKSLETKGTKITKTALIAVIDQIGDMMFFNKKPTYDIGDIVTYKRYWFGLICVGETIGNTIVRVEYKDFYLYNANRFTDKAFREHIFSKLEFEELRRVSVKDTNELEDALERLKIEKDKWINYIFVGRGGRIYYKQWQEMAGSSTTEYLGKLARKQSSK